MKLSAQSKFKFYSDDGHGWLAVKKKYLQELGIADKISGYSYQKGLTAYLEEDCDAEVFVKAMKQHFPRFNTAFNFQFIEHDGRSPIRSYSRYSNS